MTTAIITLTLLYILSKPIRFIVLDWCEADDNDNWYKK